MVIKVVKGTKHRMSLLWLYVHIYSSTFRLMTFPSVVPNDCEAGTDCSVCGVMMSPKEAQNASRDLREVSCISDPSPITLDINQSAKTEHHTYPCSSQSIISVLVL